MATTVSIALPDSGWSAKGPVTGALVAGGYRVTAAGGEPGRPGIRYALDGPIIENYPYRFEWTVEASDEIAGAVQRVTVYWIVTNYGELPYGEGPYGGGVIAEQVQDLDGTVTTYAFEGVAPDGATGIAIEAAAADTATWPAGAWMQATGSALYVEPAIAYPVATEDPVPHVHMHMTGLDGEGAATATVHALANGVSRPVRGGWQMPVASIMVLDDFLAPFGVPIQYSVQLHDSSGADLGEPVVLDAQPIAFEGTIVQHVLDPYLSTACRLLVGSDSELVWTNDGELVRPGSTRYPTWIGAGRWPLQDVPLKLATDTAAQEAAMRRVFGLDSDSDHLPIIALRTSLQTRWPDPFQVVVPEVRPEGIDWTSGGHLTHWHLTASEVQPPAISLTRPGVTWADLMAVHPTWEAVRAAYPTWAALLADTNLGGASNA